MPSPDPIRRALFLDRDGTINVDKRYVHRPEDFEWVPGIIELCRAATRAGYSLLVITNQSGIERGYFTEEDYEAITAYMRRGFATHGIALLDVLHCPWLRHPDRKPEPGMFLKARDRWRIDMRQSLSLGDKERDVQAARRAGVGRNYLLGRGVHSDLADAVLASPRELIPFLQTTLH